MVVDKMQRELSDLQPVLATKTVDTETLLVQVRQPRHNRAIRIEAATGLQLPLGGV